MPDLYLAIDLDAKNDQALEDMPDELPFKGVAAVMLDHATNGDGWVRHWRAFPGDQREEAIAYAKKHPTLVLIPLDMGTVPMDLTT